MNMKLKKKMQNQSGKSMRTQILRAIKKSPRIPADQARRLNALIDKSKVQKLTSAEEKELRRILELVDRTTFWNVTNAYAEYWRGVQDRIEGKSRARRVTRQLSGK
jgi:hypothetical protein